MTTPNHPAAGGWVGPPIIDKTGYRPSGELFDGFIDNLVRSMFTIPAGFPWWYVPPQLALEVGPWGKFTMDFRAFAEKLTDALNKMAATIGEVTAAFNAAAAVAAAERKHQPPFWAIDPTRSKPPRR